MTEDSRSRGTSFRVRRDGDVVWVAGPITDNRPHKHQALQITWAAPGTTARLRFGDTLIEGSCLGVDGDVEHMLTVSRGLVALIDGKAALARHLRTRFLADADAAIIDGPTWDGAFEAPDDLMSVLAGPVVDAHADARVHRVLEWLDTLERSGTWAEVTLDGALAIANLSEGRFLHLFSETVGTPWRSYLVWRRALVAMAVALDGASLTEAAQHSGYADSAHLSRQFVALFGVTPFAFARHSQFVQA